jgi:deoxyribodipyrimidine photo-lyase
MRQMNETGYMHNRGRMIVASYLIKNKHIHFKYGEEYFESKLLDYNLSSNNGGWQWVNGSGVDSQPPYQKFSMILQNKKYDSQCVYVKTWVPELIDMTPQEIFELYNHSS